MYKFYKLETCHCQNNSLHRCKMPSCRQDSRPYCLMVQSRFTETRFAKTLTLTPNPNFDESRFGESGRHPASQQTICSN